MAGIIGRKGDMVAATIVSLTLSADETINAGDALEYSGERQCKKFAGGTFAGFAVGNSSREIWKQHDTVSALQIGTVWVNAADEATANAAVGLSAAGAAADAAAVTYVHEILGSRFVEGGADGAVLVQLNGVSTKEITG